LDPGTGSVRWTTQLKEQGPFELMTMFVSGYNVYLGIGNKVVALSAVNGNPIWQYQVSKSSVYLPTIVLCGMCIFVSGNSDMAFLNAADGSVRWTAKFSSGMSGRSPTGAWDGENHILLGLQGYLYPIDLRTGTVGERINLKGTGYCNVALIFDKYRKVFYASASGALFAVSAGDTNTIVWKSPTSIRAGPCMALEVETGRIYIVYSSRISCFDTNGTEMFTKKFDEPMLSRGIYKITLDLLGSGRIFISSAGYYAMVDSEGNQIEDDKLDGMRYGQTFVCSSTASPDPNSVVDQQNMLVMLLSSN